jgi:hypothetical protein
LARIDKTLKFKEGHLELMSDERSDDLLTFHNEHFHPDETLAKSIGLVLDFVYSGQCLKKTWKKGL